jgi:uncharacterized protein (UPF0248 family)
MRIEPAFEQAAGVRAMVKVTFNGRDGVTEREVPSADFEPVERGLSMGPLLVPWARVFRYDLIVHQPFVPDADDEGSRATQRVVYEDEGGNQRTIEVPFDRFESGPWSATMVAERDVDADRGEILIRKTSIPWHRIIETERIFNVPEASPARPDR